MAEKLVEKETAAPQKAKEKLPFVVNDACFESYPCKHFVKTSDGKRCMMDARKIYKLHVDHGIEVPKHFQYAAQDSKEMQALEKTATKKETQKLPFVVNADVCYESYPCMHHVKMNDGQNYLMDARKIYNLYLKHGVEVPQHFQYANPNSKEMQALAKST